MGTGRKNSTIGTGYRVYGNDGLWDVTSNNLVIKTLHSGVAITPKIQANSYLTRITTAKP